jgi:hypothetical protein
MNDVALSVVVKTVFINRSMMGAAQQLHDDVRVPGCVAIFDPIFVLDG